MGVAVMRHKAVGVLVVLLLAAGLLATAVGLGIGPWPGDDVADGPATTTPSAVPPPSGPGLDLPTPPPAPAVLAAAEGGPPIALRALRQHLAPALALPGIDGLGLAVSQLGRSATILRVGPTAVTPASTLKLLTTTAALSALGPGRRFATTVVRGRTPSSIVLVGGGDPLLTDATARPSPGAAAVPTASLEELATATARRLRAGHVRRVSLAYDASLFTGPAVNPHWPATYIPEYVVSPISALWIDEGHTTPGLAERSADPALAAALAFRDRLGEAGIKVLAEPTARAPVRASSRVMASVSSAPLGELVEHILETSDNEGAEVLLRQVAIATGRPGSSAAGSAAVSSVLTALGLRTTDAAIYDGSGLSRDNVVPVGLLLDVMTTAAAPDSSDLRAVITGLPVAGFNGSLGYRFDEPEAADGRGLVRAKTGTLTGVHALAGMAVTGRGQVLFFVAVADEVPVPLTLEARDDLDELTAALTTCGC